MTSINNLAKNNAQSKETKGKGFSPLLFLASLGAGGIAVMPFAFLQYTLPHKAGLVKLSDIAHGTLPLSKELLFYSLEAIMVVFTVIHIMLTVWFGTKFFKWLKTKEYKNVLNDPLRNATLLAPFISIIMTMNVMIGPLRFFIPWMQQNFQSMFLPAMIFWSLMFVLLIRYEIKLLKISFINGFDIDKISFGWLLHPFALGMLTVVGTGIAAMAQDTNIAHTAAFMALISGSMGFFLLLVKMVMIFKSHFNAKGLPEKQFLPSFLIVVPNITLYAISAFRFGHYLEHNFGFELGAYFMIIMTLAFAFETWYILFGLALLKDYFTKHYFKKEYYVTLWGLICPIVAYGVLGSFVFSVFIPSMITYVVVVITMLVAVIFYLDLLIRHFKCKFGSKEMQC